MPDCPVCSFGNPPDASQCGNCGADLRSDARTDPVVPYVPVTGPGRFAAAPAPPRPASPRPASDTPRPRVPSQGSRAPSPTPAAGAGKRTGADLALDPASLEVQPGSSVAATVTVHNLGSEVEHFRLEVNGPAGRFATAEPPELRMTKGAKGTAVIRFSPARRPDQPAGPQQFQVVARSSVNSDVAPRATGTVAVGPYAQIGAELLPEVTRGRRPGTQRIEVVNEGNEPTTVLVELHDKDNELVFEPRSFDERLAPGERKDHAFTVCGPRPWFGRTQTFPFTAAVEAPGVPQPVRLDGTRRQVPRFPWWVPTVALALVGVAIALYALLPKPTLPNVVGLDEAAAVERIEGDGYESVVIPQVNADVPVGEVFDTTPKANTEVKKDEFVSLFVSLGPCEGECPPVVPDVALLPIASATTQLQRAALTPTEDRIPDAQVPVDRVIRTNPVAGEPAPGGTVTVFVSAGPAPASGTEGGTASADATPTDAGGGAGGGAGGDAGAGLTMPNLSGKTLAAAVAALARLGFDEPPAARTRTDEADPGTVLTTEPASGQPLTRDTMIALTVAAPLAVDLVTAAEDATWKADGDPLAFATVPTGPPPTAYVTDEPAVLGDGSSAVVLVTQPAAAPGSTVVGTFAVPGGILPGDRLTADVGFLAGNSGSVTFTMRADGVEAEEVVVSAADGRLRPLELDLTTASEGTSVTVTVTVGQSPTAAPRTAAPPVATGAPPSDPAAVPYAAVWKNLQIVGPNQ